MELPLKRLIITVIAVSISVPSIYYTTQFYDSSLYDKNPEHYIPPDASFIGLVNNGSSHYYAFLEGTNPGIITSISVFEIPQLLNYQGVSENTTQNISLVYFEEYRGINVFQLSGINASSVLDAFVGSTLGLNIFINTTLFSVLLGNLSFYIASPQNTLSIIGNRSVVEHSINACLDRSNILTSTGLVFNHTSNVSLFLYPPQTPNFNHLSANLSYNHTELYLAFKDLNSTTQIALSSIALQSGFSIRILQNSIELEADRGYSTFYRFFNSDGGVSGVESGAKV